MTAADDALDERIAQLYLLPPTDFIPARTALAKVLKADGQREAAAELAKLRRPTVVAWALNQLRRVDPDALDEFGRSVARLRQAQEQALGGDRTVDLRAAVAERREHSGRLIQAASRALREIDRDPEPHLAAMGATIEAAAADPEVGELLRTGRLTTERSAPGFDADAWAVPVPPRRRPAAVPPKREEPRVVRARAKDARQAAAAAERQLKAAERRVETADADVAAAQGTVDRLEEELRAARKAFTDLDRAARAAHKDLDAAVRRRGGGGTAGR